MASAPTSIVDKKEFVFDAKTFLKETPHLPGVYRMLDEHGHVLYVGKANDLKKRVSSYFRSQLMPRTAVMVQQIHAIELTITRSETEALLLEAQLIKHLQPRYNILFRDDKTYPYLTFSGHEFPQMLLTRALKHKEGFFGPYPNVSAAREAFKRLQYIFRLRSCRDHVFANRARPCLLYEIKRCSAPCVHFIGKAAYMQDVERAKAFLRGDDTKVIHDLSAKMSALADNLDFEEAARVRDQIKVLTTLKEKQAISSSKAIDADVFAIVKTDDQMMIYIAHFRQGQHEGDESIKLKVLLDDATEAIETFILSYYDYRPIPKEIIINAAFDPKPLAQVLSDKSQRKTIIRLRVADIRKTWLDMAMKNAELALNRQHNEENPAFEKSAALAGHLGLSRLDHIECFDISHTMGQETVASCVVFDKGAMQKNDYRRYNIMGITPGDDYAAMAQAVKRRYAKKENLPDLIVIDGGKGQLKAAMTALQELGIALPVIGIAKGPAREVGEETIFFPDQSSLLLDRHDPAFHLLLSIRDEAHRFAVQSHRKKRRKAGITSLLDEIHGIGSKRKKMLLTSFGGIDHLKRASVDDIARIDGIGRNLAEKIHAQLH